MGWFAVVPAFKLVRRCPTSSRYSSRSAACSYTLGAVVYATRTLDVLPRRFGFHEVFHLFVLAGAAAQFVAIAGFSRSALKRRAVGRLSTPAQRERAGRWRRCAGRVYV